MSLFKTVFTTAVVALPLTAGAIYFSIGSRIDRSALESYMPSKKSTAAPVATPVVDIPAAPATIEKIPLPRPRLDTPVLAASNKPGTLTPRRDFAQVSLSPAPVTEAAPAIDPWLLVQDVVAMSEIMRHAGPRYQDWKIDIGRIATNIRGRNPSVSLEEAACSFSSYVDRMRNSPHYDLIQGHLRRQAELIARFPCR